MKGLLSVILFLPFLLHAQLPDKKTSYGGVQFDTVATTWQEVLIKAKKENKYLFVDFYTTWCGPCKAMDKNVYTLHKVGDFVNDKFVSIKVQLDTNKNDNELIKKWYSDANYLMRKYGINTFPTYLFFSPEAELVHRDRGYKGSNGFLGTAKDALDPQKQIYTLIKQYRENRLGYESYAPLSIAVNGILDDKKLSDKIALDYLRNHLYEKDDRDLINKDDLTFIAKYIKKTNEKGFHLFRQYGDEIDKIIRIGYSQDVIDKVITMEYVDTKIWKYKDQKSFEPKWSRIESRISIKYSKGTTDRIVINSKIRWHRYKENWSELAKNYIEKIDTYGLDTSYGEKAYVNDMIWEVFFLHCNDKEAISKAINWMEKIVKIDPYPVVIDTYANLLYKSGRVDEAILWEEKALKIEEDAAKRNNAIPDNVYKETLSKMQSGIPTWVVSN
jgi:thioredoxin-related protein